jgi:hypothetical protein
MKFQQSTFSRAGEARMLAVEGEREIARAIVAFFVRLFARNKDKRSASTGLILH